MDAMIRAAERTYQAEESNTAFAAWIVARRRAGETITPLSGYDWEAAFGNEGAGEPSLFPRVVEIVATSEGENDGDSWVGLFRLDDGSYVGINAWCDYTGWG